MNALVGLFPVTVLCASGIMKLLLKQISEEEKASAAFLRVNADVPREPTPTLESLADDNTPDMDTLKRMLEGKSLTNDRG